MSKKFIISSLLLLQSCVSHKPFNDGTKINVAVIVDVFRAAATSSYVLENRPSIYYISTESQVLEELSKNLSNTFFIGKSENGRSSRYNTPNSPTKVAQYDLKDRVIMHRTADVARGIIDAKNANLVLLAGFVNSSATAKYLKSLKNPKIDKIQIIPTGHKGAKPILEDYLCAEYISALIKGETFNFNQHIQRIKRRFGSYYFEETGHKYLVQDFYRSLDLDRFNFVIVADAFDKFAILSRIDQ